MRRSSGSVELRIYRYQTPVVESFEGVADYNIANTLWVNQARARNLICPAKRTLQIDYALALTVFV